VAKKRKMLLKRLVMRLPGKRFVQFWNQKVI